MPCPKKNSKMILWVTYFNLFIHIIYIYINRTTFLIFEYFCTTKKWHHGGVPTNLKARRIATMAVLDETWDLHLFEIQNISWSKPPFLRGVPAVNFPNKWGEQWVMGGRMNQCDQHTNLYLGEMERVQLILRNVLECWIPTGNSLWPPLVWLSDPNSKVVCLWLVTTGNKRSQIELAGWRSVSWLLGWTPGQKWSPHSDVPPATQNWW